ncbi:uncharacterized protein HMPREF1541_00099 [Cyphellophora europaea CBS 101466]|uniref:Uncharacterized protein n=1 Tax=Cyphellophora europaea (strain CBS 101466) TaxID=1220924 RepID=W2SD37_CYPE1|nr:uncharacterized protein HMPREF1541_00099 [Cyphellophora europaea CBS 101466]ETN45918.1 hypothetical protein HMPREF1541_00099 [Cyphellophora europaea CBS 101466]
MSNRNGTRTALRKCPVSHHTTDQEDFEHDFTTKGRIGNLDCPFARMAQTNGLPDTPESNDPIAAEFHQDQVSINSPTTASGPAGRCPIRFLDKHSPEEIAKYFENHKHELPRSHQVCVSRYQRNEAGAKELDAKYGSMVNMIQGLGVKHKQYLPEAEGPVKQEASSTDHVEKWAENVSDASLAPKKDEGDDQRLSHFDRPLREVRVGESPSRPWGISVPVAKDIPASAMGSEASAQQHAPTGLTSPAAVPAGHQTSNSNNRQGPTQEAGKTAEQTQKPSADQTAPTTTAPPTQIIFNGPVFFGYSPNDAAAFLQLLNNGGGKPNGS